MEACSECASFPHTAWVRCRFDDVKLMSADCGIWDRFLSWRRKPFALRRATSGNSTMSDLDRNYASPFGRAAGRIDAAAVDAGLRAYMLRIYNYMSIGLAITGLAALGVYMAAVTTDPSGAAAKIGNSFLTPFGYAMYVSPLKWLFILAPLAMVFVISAGIDRLRPAAAQMLFWVFSAPVSYTH